MRTPIIAGNWKMHKTVGESVDLVKALLTGLGDVGGREVLICPPYTALYGLRPLLVGTAIQLGAQELFYEAQGAYTGAISAGMLADVGCRYVIVGHSERRQLFGETDEGVSKRAHAAIAAGLTPIVCVGETKAERDQGVAESVVARQIAGGLAGLSAEQVAALVIAYEPVWAIGTGDTATSADAQAMHAAIRGLVGTTFGAAAAAAVRIQYGGSVKPDNVDELMAQPDIDGALVGGASLKADSFLRIVQFQ